MKAREQLVKKHLFAIIAFMALIAGSMIFLNSCNRDCVHSWSEWHITEEADCAKDGGKQRECSICGEKESIAYSAQNHTYSPEWTYDSTSHWYTAVCEHTDERSETGAHVIENNACKICGFDGTEGLSYTFVGAGFYTVDGIGSSTETDIFIPARYNDGVHGEAPVGTVNYKAFAGNTSLRRIRLPDSVTMIGNAAFRDCTALGEVVLPDSITRIYPSAFSGCISLTNIKLPSALVYMGERLFEGCSALEPHAPSTCILRVASEKGGVESEKHRTLVLRVTANMVKMAEKRCFLMLIDTVRRCRRAVDEQ